MSGTINYDKLNTELKFTEIKDNDRSKGQKIAYPELQEFIQGPWIKLDSYGVPRAGDFYKDEASRCFIKTPLNQVEPEIKKFSDIMKDIDKHLSNDTFKGKLFAKHATKYQYQPIFRLPQEEDDDETKKDAKKKYGPKQPYLKFKIDTTYPDNGIKTQVFKSVMKNDKRERSLIANIKTIDDFAQNVCWMSRIRPIFRIVKLWAQAPNKKDPTYGITLKLIKIEVEPPMNMKMSIDNTKNDFLDSDEEIDEIKSISLKETPKPIPQKNGVAEVPSDDSDDDEAPKKVVKKMDDSDDESDESSEEEEVKPVKKQPVKQTSKNSSK
jgi:hypothetical protein